MSEDPGSSFPLGAEPGRPRRPLSPRAGQRRLAIVGAFIIVIAVVGVAAAVGRNHTSSAVTAWDDRVVDLVDFVETARGLEFDHPVPIEFMTAKQYSAETRTADTELSDEDREFFAQEAGLYRALGLAEGDLDLFEAGNDLSDTGTLAFYSSEHDRIVVRADPDIHELPPDLRVTLVHELTHALQFQHFEEPTLETSDADFAWTALIEGDATRIENLYIDGFDDDDLAAYQASFDDGGSGSSGSGGSSDDPTAEGVPEALVAIFGAPYTLGDAYLAILDADGGQDSVDDAFRDPPTTDEQIVDPLTYLDGHRAKEVLPPSTSAKGDKELYGDSFGVVTLLMMLADRLDPHQALDAADGWNGGAYTSFEHDGHVCMKAVMVADDVDAARTLSDALTQWAGAMPAAAKASVLLEGMRIRLASCDPGADADLPIESGASVVLNVPIVRNYLASGALDSHRTADDARCIGDQVVANFTAEQLGADEVPSNFDDVVEKAYETC